MTVCKPFNFTLFSETYWNYGNNDPNKERTFIFSKNLAMNQLQPQIAS